MRISFKKLAWGIRALLYKCSFQHFGSPSYIGKPMFVEGRRRIYIGKKVRIFPGIRLEALEGGTIKIEDNVAIEQNCHITSEGSSLVIGEGSVILGHTVITNIDHDYRNPSEPVLSQEHIISETRIGKNCFIGFGAVIQAGTVLGEHCVVGAGSVVRGAYPDFCVIVGTPGKIVKRYNKEKNQWERTSYGS